MRGLKDVIEIMESLRKIGIETNFLGDQTKEGYFFHGKVFFYYNVSTLFNQLIAVYMYYKIKAYKAVVKYETDCIKIKLSVLVFLHL